MSDSQKRTVSRRSVTRAAAWSVPAVAVVAAAPAFAASPIDVGAFSITGTCGTGNLGLLGVGYRLTAGATDLPAGTTVTVTQTGVNIGLLNSDSSLASVTLVNGNNVIQLAAPLPANASINFTATINVSVLWSSNATLTLPSGFTSSTGKYTGGIGGTLVLCNAS